ALRAELPRLVDGGHAATPEHLEDLVARKGGRVLHRHSAVRAGLVERGDGGTEQRGTASTLGRQEGCHGGLAKAKHSLNSCSTCFRGQRGQGGNRKLNARAPVVQPGRGVIIFRA